MEHRTAAFSNLLLFLTTLTFTLSQNTHAQSTTPETLPVYQVTRSGATEEMVKGLSDNFKVGRERFAVRNGLVSFVDADKFLSIPSRPVSDPAVLKMLKDPARTEINDATIRYDALDIDGLHKLTVLDDAKALKLAASAFSSLHLELARPVVKHTTFSASYTGDNGSTVSVNQQLDTRVSYAFTDKNGYSFTGPGAHVQVTFNADGGISQLHYAWREVKAGPSVKIISEAEARSRIAKILPPGAQIDLKLVYWCPPFETASDKAAPAAILPWYSFTGTTEKRNKAGGITRVTSKERLIPATDDAAYIPTARLKVSGEGTARVEASVEVAGGHPPYTYTWTGSNPSVLGADASSVSYEPLTRAAATPGAVPIDRARSNETVSVMVTDANGITTQVSQVIAVIAHPITPADSHGGESHAVASYGCESPGEPEEWSMERQGWQQGMAKPGGGNQAFCWLGDASWPGDYIKPSPAGSLPASPWIHGDADYANWGVNTANLVLVNGDGWPDGFTAMYPGAPQSDYNSKVDLFRPTNPGSTMVLPIPTDPTYYDIKYTNSWGPVGPNDRLYWLAGLLCDCLDPTDGGNLTPSQRWGPAFGGLHIFTGFASGAAYSAGAFPKAFAEDILGTNGPAQTIKNAWFHASTATNEGSAAAMGPITNGGVCDINDYYIGKGSRGPTITGSAVKGWWYLHQ